MSLLKRPQKYGDQDRRIPIVQDSEVAIRIQNDANGNPIYIGRARIGGQTDADIWQISFNQYDANDALISRTWPENDIGNASAEYEFVWDDRATYTYS